MIKENIVEIQRRISSICSGAKRDPGSVAIVAVSKGRDVSRIEDAVRCGITHIGEKKVQEALSKYKVLSTIDHACLPDRQGPSTITWHMVGHLQTNKAKDAVRIFDLIESVDSLHLAEEIDRQAARIHKIQDILVEVDTAHDKSKFGINPEGAGEFLKEILSFGNIRVKGLMTIAPAVDDPEKARPYFSQLRKLLNEINDINETNDNNAPPRLTVLSMGMSADFEVAVQEGSTQVRLGRAVFDTVL